jgi:hypothetical protein
MLGSLVLGGVACLGDCSGSAIVTGSATHTGSGTSASSGAGAGSGGGEDGWGGSVEEVGVIVSGGRLGGVLYQSGWVLRAAEKNEATACVAKAMEVLFVW